jgi:anti-sigma factor RsiW
MTCRDIIEFLMEFADGTVSAEERTLFEAHLAICPPCVAYLESYRVTIRLAQGALGDSDDAETPVPEELVSAVLAARQD